MIIILINLQLTYTYKVDITYDGSYTTLPTGTKVFDLKEDRKIIR